MLIRPKELAAIAFGEIDLAFRRWDRPRLLVGTKMRTQIGLVEVTSVDRVAASAIRASDARRAGATSRADLLAKLAAHPERPIYRVGLRFAGDDPRVALRNTGEVTDDERAMLLAKLSRLDSASRRGEWTETTLRIIERSPAVRAPDLAAELGLETVVFKRDVRKLKELGLTHSLDVGYELSPRGRTFLNGGS